MSPSKPIEIPLDVITPEFLQLHDKPGPRYTSYPTAVEFNDRFNAADYTQRLAKANANAQSPLSLYVHLPFCAKRCTFCGCNVIVAKRKVIVDRYLEYLSKELDLLAAALPDRRKLVQYHWGGGTPTHLDLDQMGLVSNKVKEHFEVDPNGEVALEVDPEVTTVSQLELANELGFNRLSVGVQDFEPKVLEASGRLQSEEQTHTIIQHARRLGFKSVNMDLIYGLPHQTLRSFEKTLDKVIHIRPDRIAMYSFAFVPWMKKNQEKIPTLALPDRDTKFGLFALAIRKFLNAGYIQIGMDHFALPEDEMGQAVTNGTLYRNFMGYTVHRSTDMLGVGVSSIGFIERGFSQNYKHTKPYYAALDHGTFPVEKGYVLSPDDAVRQAVITELMCNFRVDFNHMETHFGINFKTYFKHELDILSKDRDSAEFPFTEQTNSTLKVTPIGRLFIRNVCMAFDIYLKNKSKDTPMFSRTV